MKNIFKNSFFKSRSIQAAFIGLVAVPLTVILNKYLAHPKSNISVKILEMNWIGAATLPEAWILTINLRVVNSGDQDTSIEYKNFAIKLSGDNNAPYSFPINRAVIVPSQRILYDSLRIHLPNLSNPKSFEYGWIDVFLPIGTTKVHFSSHDVESIAQFSSRTVSFSDSQFIEFAKHNGYVIYDSLGNPPQLKFQKYYVNYDGAVYELKIFPPVIEVTHEVIDDRIKLHFRYLSLSSSSKNKGQRQIEQRIMRPVVLAHERIVNKLDIPGLIVAKILSIKDRSQTRYVTSYEKVYGKNFNEYKFVFKDSEN